MTIAIKVENLSKQYRLGTVGTGTLSHDLNRWWAKMRGKEDPALILGERNDRTQKGSSDWVWALKDVSFDVKQGDVLGIVGRNGAGKSTLLKILSRTTTPTLGEFKVKGRIASLLEVGTGFHPELTGRENVYLNGAILGMRKHEITRKFDEIVDFSGVERYVDTPVKRYSSGMYVRLAFAVAAHLEPEILIVDEVLAVGDLEFQKKCIGKMKDVSVNEGRTVLFVSHNMAAIYALTNNCLFLQHGSVMSLGPTQEIATLYQQSNDFNTGNNSTFAKPKLDAQKPIELLSASVSSASNSEVAITVSYIVRKDVGAVVAARVNTVQGVPIVTLMDTDQDPNLFKKKPGKYEVHFTIPMVNLTPNTFKVTLSFSDMKSERFDFLEDLLSFQVEDETDANSTIVREGVIKPRSSYVGQTHQVD
jgi:lipopolysaccharide transport system ATP-binding protein